TGREPMARTAQQNVILSRLSEPDFRLLERRLEPVDLPVNKYLERRGEGISGLAVVLGNDRNANDVFIQVAGRGHCLRADDLRKAIEKSVTLHRSLLRYAHTFLEQATRTAVANGRSKVEERLARWLLMADDRLDGAEVPL